MHEGHEETAPLPAEVERVGRAVLDAAFKVHSALGPGLLESVYETCLAEELRRAGLKVERQVGVPVAYGDVRMDVGFRLDLLVEDRVVIEGQGDRRPGGDPYGPDPDLSEVFRRSAGLSDQLQRRDAQEQSAPGRALKPSCPS